ncbi:MAG: hypothetical protein LBE08_09530 [Bifidobacteriaceae bacterium]|nr:hypothetical protein [Bifidobacteriaceae bacterium]
MSLHTPITTKWLDMMKQLQSEYLGVVIDLGIFCYRHPRVATAYFKALGLSDPVAAKVNELYSRHGDVRRLYGVNAADDDYFPPELSELFTNQTDRDYAFFAGGYENTPLEVFDEYIDYLKHIHAKFYEMLDDGSEYSIDYPAIITKLNQLGYDNYLSSEYEGQRFVPLDEPIEDLEPLRRHQAMLAAHINDGK